jgi:hypothetical protein
MAEIATGDGGKHKGGKKRGKKMSTRVDFTPMVDLGIPPDHLFHAHHEYE